MAASHASAHDVLSVTIVAIAPGPASNGIVSGMTRPLSSCALGAAARIAFGLILLAAGIAATTALRAR